MIIFDIEIKNVIAPKNPAERKDGIEYCDGWEDYAGMGIAVVAVYDYTTDRTRVFGEDNLKPHLQELIDQSDKVVGFNNNRFDNNVLKANGVVIPPQKSYDILAEIFSALGSFQKGCRLDDVVKANFPNNAGKTANGADAPVWWQQGKHASVVDYCIQDVRLTKMIVDKILRFGFINNPVNPSQILRLKRP